MSRPATIDAPARSLWPGGLGLVLLVALTFWPVLTFDFVRWDDDNNITHNPLLTAPWSWDLVTQMFSGNQALRFKPLHWLGNRGLHALFGFEPVAWHAFNLALHLAATVLFYVVLRQVFGRLAPDAKKLRADWAAFAGAGLWALHPLRAEAVAWATASTYPLTAVALLGSFACYLQAFATRGRRWLFAAWVLAVAAYASYPVAITYGLWLMAADCWLLPGDAEKEGPWATGRSRAWGVKHAAFLAPAALAVGVTLWSRYAAPGMFTTAPTVESVGLATRATMALASLAWFVRHLVWPVDLTPNLPPVDFSSGTLLSVTALAGLVLLGLLIIWQRRMRAPRVALVVLGFVALALPCLGLTEQPTWPVDRYGYIVHLVLIGGAAGWLMGWAGDRRGRLVAGGLLLGGLALASAFAARRQAMIWQDNTTLFTHMERAPHFADNPRQQGHIYYLWGSAEVVAARPARAAALFDRAQQVYLAAIRAAVGRADYAEALSLSTHLERNFALTPVMHRERGAWLLRLGRRPEALAELQIARAALPEDARTRALQAEAARTPGQP